MVLAPQVRAVGFTGSHGAGRALHELGATRPEPIPVYAEMGSLNPVFVTPGAWKARGPEIVEGFVASMTTGTGQFCTKPGLAFGPPDLAGRVAERLSTVGPGPMLSEPIRRAFVDRLSRTSTLPGVDVVLRGVGGDGDAIACSPSLLASDVDTFLETPDLSEEHFGPLSVAVRCDLHRMPEVVARLRGSLAIAVHAEPDEHAALAEVLDAMVDRAGRIVWNGFPTGVAVVPSMHHGGPYPATTNPLHTSVGMTAVRRFLRPVAYQNAPDDLLPPALRDGNPLGIRRLVDWEWTDRPVARASA